MPLNQTILDAFDSAHKKRFAVKHPLCAGDIRLRTAFVHAAALVFCVDGENNVREELKRLAHSLEIPGETIDQAVSAAESAESDLVESIIDTVTDKSEQMLLILDLYRLALADGVLGPDEKKIIDQTCKMLKISKYNMDLLRRLGQLISTQESKAIHEVLNSDARGKLEIDPDYIPYLLQDIPDWQKVVRVKKKVVRQKPKQTATQNNAATVMKRRAKGAATVKGKTAKRGKR